jgi:tetratricopeptide (TPR) repeat protein
LQQAVQVNPRNATSFLILGNCQLAIEKIQDARAAYDQALALKAEPVGVHSVLYSYAVLKGDAVGAEAESQQLNDAVRARLASVSGRILEFRRGLGQRANRIGQAGGMNEAAAIRMFGAQALIEAVTGNDAQAQFAAQTALRVAPLAIEPAAALAIIGRSEGVQILERAQKEFPDGTLLNSIWLPLARSGMESRARNSAKALELLEPARMYETSTYSLMTVYARGMVLLQTRSGSEAAAEFQKILSHAGVAAIASPPVQILYPLSRLGLARSYAAMGNIPQARQAYQEFFAMWKDAEPTIPVVQQARREFTSLGALRGAGRGGRGQR